MDKIEDIFVKDKDKDNAAKTISLNDCLNKLDLDPKEKYSNHGYDYYKSNI
jgi:hypothetical protein